MSVNQSSPMMEETLRSLERVVIKIGTRVIDDEQTHFNRPVMESLVSEIATLRKRNIETILVSSGAVGAGMRTLGVQGPTKSLHLRQAYAAVGQNRLMNLYQEMFDRHGIKLAQVLLTGTDLDRRSSYLNARETLQHLLTIGVLPIINENDTVAVEELKFSDNDQLAALVAGKINANLLILLTTVDGIMKSYDPATKTGEIIEVVQDNLEEIAAEIRDDVGELSMGGMQSKFQSAVAACSKGVLVAIANGLRPGVIADVLSGTSKATWVLPTQKRMAAWKYYLAFAKRPCEGKIVVDEGAVRALRERGKSLLASGIRSVAGTFHPKDLVRVFDEEGNEVARGLVNYSSGDVDKICGKNTGDIQDILNDDNPRPVIHRDQMVLT